MRLWAEERQSGSAVLLLSSPVSEREIVLGKFLSAWLCLALVTFATTYMPLLVFVHGKVTLGQIVAGYAGLLLLGGAATAVGLFGSVLAPSQLAAALVTGGLLVCGVTAWWLALRTDPPVRDVLAYASIYQRHFPPFLTGVVRLSAVAYYGTVMAVFVFASVRVLEARRWG
jgi:ABC-2 type transport system permease protein